MTVASWQRKQQTIDDIFLSTVESKRALFLAGGAMVSIYTLGVMEALQEMELLDGAHAPDTICASSGSAANMIHFNLRRDAGAVKEIWREVIDSDVLSLVRGRKAGRPPLDIDHLCSKIFSRYMYDLDEDTFARAQAKMYVGVTDIDSAEFGYLPVTSPAHLIDRLHTTMALPGLYGAIDIVGPRKLVDGFIDPLPFNHFKNPEQMEYLIMAVTAPKDQKRDLKRVERVYLAVCHALGRGVNETMYHALINRNRTFQEKYMELLVFQQQQGRTIIIQPEHALPANATCKDMNKVEATRLQGYRDAYAQRRTIEKMCFT